MPFGIVIDRAEADVNGQSRPVAPESPMHVARGATHDIRNDGDGELSFAWIVTPPGLDTLVRRVGVERTPGMPEPAPFKMASDARDAYRRAGLTLSPDAST